MKRKEIIELLEEVFPKDASDSYDFIGLQSQGKEEVEKIMVCLDPTLEVISQAVEKKIDMIICHHPLFFGDKEEILSKDLITKNKYLLLQKLNINLFVIHSNADYNPESIAFHQAVALETKNINQLELNKGVICSMKERLNAEKFLEYLKNSLELKHKLRTNIDPSFLIKDLVIGSGASGELIYNNHNWEKTFIIGELKYHQWVYALENGIKIIELGHFSESIFKNIVKIALEKTNLEVILGEEENGYWEV